MSDQPKSGNTILCSSFDGNDDAAPPGGPGGHGSFHAAPPGGVSAAAPPQRAAPQQQSAPAVTTQQSAGSFNAGSSDGGEMLVTKLAEMEDRIRRLEAQRQRELRDARERELAMQAREVHLEKKVKRLEHEVAIGSSVGGGSPHSPPGAPHIANRGATALIPPRRGPPSPLPDNAIKLPDDVSKIPSPLVDPGHPPLHPPHAHVNRNDQATDTTPYKDSNSKDENDDADDDVEHGGAVGAGSGSGSAGSPMGIDDGSKPSSAYIVGTGSSNNNPDASHMLRGLEGSRSVGSPINNSSAYDSLDDADTFQLKQQRMQQQAWEQRLATTNAAAGVGGGGGGGRPPLRSDGRQPLRSGTVSQTAATTIMARGSVGSTPTTPSMSMSPKTGSRQAAAAAASPKPQQRSSFHADNADWNTPLEGTRLKRVLVAEHAERHATKEHEWTTRSLIYGAMNKEDFLT